MASLREAIADELVSRLDAIPNWTAQRRGSAETTTVKVLAIVATFGESKEADQNLYYENSLRLGVMIQVQQQDADPDLDDGNVYSYLDRMVALAEKAVHATPWPNDQEPLLDGHDVEDPDGTNSFVAVLKLSIGYRHNRQDPDTYNPAFT